MKMTDFHFYPGWTRKAITFTIDDGNIAMDEKFLSIVKPAGVIGTFNLCTSLKKTMTAEDYRAFYRGYEIANHCHRHPHAFSESRNPAIAEEAFDEATADQTKAYRTDDEGFYRIYSPRANSWNYYIATEDKYMDYVALCNGILEDVFGAGTVKDFVWPFGDQQNPALTQRLIDYGFRSIRITGDVSDSTGFALPADRTRWSYNAHHKTLLENAAKYEAYPDDGELKFFAFGVHSIDFERDGIWDDLKEFCRLYGNRPKDYWYASVGDILDYEDAVKALRIENDKITNDSNVDLYVKIDGEKVVVPAHTSYSIA